MKWHNATNQQIKSIIENDGDCTPYLLGQALEEAVRRDLYKKYMTRLINNRYKAIKYAEHITKLTFEEIKYLCYEQGFEALKYYKPGKNSFISFWARFMHTGIRAEARKYWSKMRTAEMVYIDEYQDFQIVADNNTERKAVNRVYLEEVLSTVTGFEREIILKYNNDFTFKEIGNQLGYSGEHVRKKYYSTIEKLKKLGA